MKLVKQNKEKIGIALTEEELFVNIQSLVISRSILDVVSKFSDSEKTNVMNKSITKLENDYRRIHEKYKEKLARGEEHHVEAGGFVSENCELCE